MSIKNLIEQYSILMIKTNNEGFKKTILNVLSMLSELEEKIYGRADETFIVQDIASKLNNLESEKHIKKEIKHLRSILMNKYGFIPVNYYSSWGLIFGYIFGVILGFTMGVPFNNGLIYGPLIGSGIGLLTGLLIAGILEKQKRESNLILINL